MTAAVCVACGAPKIGAFTPCPRCRHDAITPSDRARALLLSARFLDPAALGATSAAIERGEPPRFDDDQVRELAATLGPAPTPSYAGMIFVGLGFLAVLAALLLMVYLGASRLISWLF